MHALHKSIALVAVTTICFAHLAPVANAYTVKAVGGNQYGQIGDGAITNQYAPVTVANMSDPVVTVEAGGVASFALMADATVRAWGNNSYGQLGIGTFADSFTAVVIPGLYNVEAIAPGEFHTLALKSDGSVWAWGMNNTGACGIGTFGGYYGTPQHVVGLNNVIAIAAGNGFSAALKEDGTVWTWGGNYAGQLGLGDNADRNVPTQVPNLSDIEMIAVGWSHVIAVAQNDMYFVWGSNYAGQLGTGADAPSSTPLIFEFTGDVTDIIKVDAGEEFTLALLADGTVKAWGSNTAGQLGNGTTGGAEYWPLTIGGLSNITDISAGGSVAMFKTADGILLSCGDNSVGSIGAGLPTGSRGLIAPVAMAASTTDFSVGGYHALIIVDEPVAPAPSCPADSAPPGGDGVINVMDLLNVINAWGMCQE